MTVRLSADNGRLRVQRAGFTRWFGSSVDVPLAHVVSVEEADPRELRSWNKGVRLMGIQIPGIVVSGIYRSDGRSTWWEVGRAGSALVISLRDERLSRVIVEVDDPTSVKHALDRALAGSLCRANGRGLTTAVDRRGHPGRP